MRILVTGATGFIGQALVERMRGDHEVWQACRPGSAFTTRPERTIEWDFGKDAAVDFLPSALDAVVHLAQSQSYRNFPEEALSSFQVNVAGTVRVLNFAVRAQATHCCLVSSGTVYDPYTGPLVEDAVLRPASWLGATKLASEVLATAYARVMRLTILRLFFPYGPGQKGRLIADVIDRVLSGKPVTVDRDGHGLVMAPTYISDVCDVIASAVNDGWAGTFNVAAPWRVTIRELAEAVGRLSGVAPRFETTDLQPKVMVPDLRRLSHVFDLKRFIPLEDGLRRTMDIPGRSATRPRAR